MVIIKIRLALELRAQRGLRALMAQNAANRPLIHVSSQNTYIVGDRQLRWHGFSFEIHNQRVFETHLPMDVDLEEDNREHSVVGLQHKRTEYFHSIRIEAYLTSIREK